MEIREITYDGKTHEVNYDPEEDAVVVDLERPLLFGEERYTEIKIKAPTWEQLDAIDVSKLTFPGLRKMAVKLTGIDSARLGKLKGQDIRRVILGVMYFLQQTLGDPTANF